MLTSGNGWPASDDQKLIAVTPYKIKGTERSIRCAKYAGPLLAGFASEFHKLIEPIDEGVFDDWAYSFRMIRGSTDKLSNHASGSAIDLNATKHPLGKAGTFEPTNVPMIRALAKKYGLRWGGDYVRKDEMHFEIMLSQAKAFALCLKLGLIKQVEANK